MMPLLLMLVATLALVLSAFGPEVLMLFKYLLSLGKAKEPELSDIGREVLNVYNEVPPTHQTSGDIIPVLLALDVKYDVTKLDLHFGWALNYTFGESRKEVQCCNNKVCEYREYRELLLAVFGVRDAYEQQQHAIEVSEHTSDLNRSDEVRQNLLLEAEVINSVTKEISK